MPGYGQDFFRRIKSWKHLIRRHDSVNEGNHYVVQVNKIEISPEQELIRMTPHADSFKIKISHFLYLVFA